MTDVRATIYRKAAELLRRDGWTQGFTMNKAGNRCLLGAINSAYSRTACHRTEEFYRGDFYQPLLKALDEESISFWNDMPERTFEEVITLLEQTAEKLEADETITEGMS